MIQESEQDICKKSAGSKDRGVVLHIGEKDKFTASLFSYMYEIADCTDQIILCRVSKATWPMTCESSLLELTGIAWLIKFIVLSARSRKIIIHGLFDFRVILLLFLQPWLLRKCYWFIWGGDLYAHVDKDTSLRYRIREVLKLSIIKRFGFLVSYVKGDIDLARSWYHARGSYIECLMYPSNICHEQPAVEMKGKTKKLLLGNSADDSNLHIEVLEFLSKYADEAIEIYAPLSYGNMEYADLVSAKGYEIFKNKFIPMTSFMPFSEYLKFLETIDIAIFHHKRQQAMGNTISLLAMGKKVYMRSGFSHTIMFESMGVHVYNLASFDLTPIDHSIKEKNIDNMRKFFSSDRLTDQITYLFFS